MLTPRVDRTLELSDGRTLAAAEWGDPQGPLVVVLHGSPLSRLWCPDVAATDTVGVRLVMPDRPGIGRSDAPEIPSMLAWTDDVRQMVDQLGVEKFSIIGISFGGMYAAACAAALGDRLVAAGSVCGAWWPADEQPGALERLDEGDRRIQLVAQADPLAARVLAAELYADWVALVRDDPARYMAQAGFPMSDMRHLQEPAWAANFYAAQQEAVRQGPWGCAWETAASLAPWGFALEDIDIRFNLWHGGVDPIESLDGVQYWAGRIPDARVKIWPESGHFVAVEHWAEILADVIG